MWVFLKSQLTSIVATAVDFCITVMLVEQLNVSYGIASGAGNIAGAITGFLLGRKWVFAAGENGLSTQATRYVLVWCGYFLLNVLLVTRLTTYTSINYIIIKITVAIVLSIAYNYRLHKRYVFR